MLTRLIVAVVCIWTAACTFADAQVQVTKNVMMPARDGVIPA